MGDTVAELASIRKRVGCLETKIDSYRRVLSQAGHALHDSASEDGFPHDSQWPSIEDLRRLREELDTALTRKHELKVRLRKWGAID